MGKDLPSFVLSESDQLPENCGYKSATEWLFQAAFLSLSAIFVLLFSKDTIAASWTKGYSGRPHTATP